VSIILSQVLFTLASSLPVVRALAVGLQPVSVFDQAGLEELAEESFALLSGENYERKIFPEPIAFNSFPLSEKTAPAGQVWQEGQLEEQIKKILAAKNIKFGLSLVQVPVFHGYSVMLYIELAENREIADIENALKKNRLFKYFPVDSSQLISNRLVAGKDEIFIGHLRKTLDQPLGFWLWMAADNLSASASNALALARKMLGIG